MPLPEFFRKGARRSVSKSYALFLMIMVLLLALGLMVFIYGLMHPASLPRLTPRDVYAFGYLPHG